MHSPPVQPSSSRTSGTGSVITMWLEVTVSRRRSGRWPASAGPPPAPPSRRGPARCRSSSDEAVTVRRGGLGARALEDPNAPLQQLRSKSEREPRRMHGGRARDRRPRRETGASRSEPGPRPRSAGGTPRARPAPRRRRRLAPGVVVGGGRRDLEVSGPAIPGVDALLLAPSPDARRPPPPAARATSSAAESPNRLEGSEG